MPAPTDPEAYALWRQRLSEARQKRVISEETKRKISAAHKAKFRDDPEYRAALLKRQAVARLGTGKPKVKKEPKPNHWIGRKHTEAAKAKMRRAALKRWADPEERARQSERVTQAYLDGKLPQAGCSQSGHFQSAKAGRVFYRSSWELAVLEQLEADPVVAWFRTEAGVVEYEYNGAVKPYIPDIYVEYTDGSYEVFEVKPSCFVDEPRNRAKFKAARSVYGTRFSVLTEDNICDAFQPSGCPS
jgi:hypothetical protein